MSLLIQSALLQKGFSTKTIGTQTSSIVLVQVIRIGKAGHQRAPTFKLALAPADHLFLIPSKASLSVTRG